MAETKLTGGKWLKATDLMLRNLAQIYLLKISDWKNTGVKKADYDSPGRIWWHHRATYRGWQEWSIFFLQEATVPSGPGCAHCLGFTITLRHTTCGRTPLDEWSASRRDLYLTTHNIHNRQTSMPPAGFEPTVPACERPQTDALDRAATWTDGNGKSLHTNCYWHPQPIRNIQITRKH